MTPGGKEILSLKTAAVTFFFYYEKTMSNMGKESKIFTVALFMCATFNPTVKKKAL